VAPSLSKARVAVLIPCFNEAAAIRDVVKDFRVALPDARIYVYDNNSSDGTPRIAAEAGAIVRFETRQGKGHVVRRMLSETDADVYVMVDGDGTYDASTSAEMVRALLTNRLAMVVGRRVHESSGAYRRGHVFGNRTLSSAVQLLFGRTFTDILSGYRVFSRAFVKSFPVMSRSFEIETELTVHALTLNLPAQEIKSPYRVRPAGSHSKLRTYHDGFRIFGMIVRLFRTERPQLFYSLIGGLLLLVSVLMAIPIVITFLKTGLVPRFPTAILASAIAVSSLLSFACGLILDTVTQGRREAKMLLYMATTRDEDSCLVEATEVIRSTTRR